MFNAYRQLSNNAEVVEKPFHYCYPSEAKKLEKIKGEVEKYHPNLTEDEFLQKTKEFVWKKYLQPTMRTFIVNYHTLREIYDLFGSIFFGYVRMMNIAHQGWCYMEALDLANATEDANVPTILNVDGDKIFVEYVSRSGILYKFSHEGENPYYDIKVEVSTKSSLYKQIQKIARKHKTS